MKVKSLGKNQTEIIRGNWRILVSYETPVAAIFTSDHVTRVLKTSTFYSQTTSKHINQWFRGIFGYDPNVEKKDQEYFDRCLMD